MGNARSSDCLSLNRSEIWLDGLRSVAIFEWKQCEGLEQEENSIRVTAREGCVALKMWPGSVVMSKFLISGDFPYSLHGKKVIEIGCGMGLVGLSIAKFMKPESVLLTDREEIRPILSASIAANADNSCNKCEFEAFDWGDGAHLVRFRNIEIDFVFGSELVYVEDQEPLTNAIEALLSERPLTGTRPILILFYSSRSDQDEQYFRTQICARFQLLGRSDRIYYFQK